MRRALLGLVAIACGSHPSPVPGSARPPAKGEVVTRQFHSVALGVTKDVVVYLPAGYKTTGKRYPVFYYLHGFDEDETAWLKKSHLDTTADSLALDAIVVMPDGDDGYYIDSAAPIDYDRCLANGEGLFAADRPKQTSCVRARKYETYIVDDLVDWVDATFRTIAEPGARGIAGLSMGGFGALHLAMRRPDRFAAAASHSGIYSLLYSGPIPYVKGQVVSIEDVSAWGTQYGKVGAWIRGLFGLDRRTWLRHDPAHLVAHLPPAKPPALYLDCGSEDVFPLPHQMQHLRDLLVDRGVEHAYYLGPGAHDHAFWSARLPHSLAFLRDASAKPR